MAELAPVVYFPETGIDYSWSPRRGNTFSTEILSLRNGTEQRRKVFVDGPYEIWEGITFPLVEANRSTLMDFWEARDGMYENFYFFRPEPYAFTLKDIGDITAVTVLEIPFKESTVTKVEVDDVDKSFTFLANQGSGGEDEITFDAGAQTGNVTITVTGRFRFIARFTSDIAEETFYKGKDLLSIQTVSVKEVR